jgi:hypothetical protein
MPNSTVAGNALVVALPQGHPEVSQVAAAALNRWLWI